MNSRRFDLHPAITLAVALAGLVGGTMAGGAAIPDVTWHMPPTGNMSFEIIKEGVAGPVYATSSTPSWWPSWGWFGYGGSSTVAGSQ
jgi:hypothetical protein